MASLRYFVKTLRNSVCLRTKCSNLIFSRFLSLSCNFCGSGGLDGARERKVYDVAIVGGGVMGSSSAYFLANRMSSGSGKICVIESDPTVSYAS